MGRNKIDRTGETYVNKYGTSFIITKYVNNKEVYVKFLDEYGYETKAMYKECLGGTIKNPFDKTVYGVGYHGVDSNGKYLVSNTREGILWKNMLVRCYSDSFLESNPTYKNCVVCERWLCFANFLEDLPKIEGYESWIGTKGAYEFDKDMKQQGVKNKVYSLETCSFIPKCENSYENSKRSCINEKKNVLAYDTFNNLLYQFDSTKEASTYLSTSASYISMICNGTRRKKGWIITYKENLPKLKIEEITHEELLTYSSERGTGALGSSGK